MKWEEFSLGVLISATSPCNAGRDQERISEQRTVPLSRVKTVVNLAYKGNAISGEQHFQPWCCSDNMLRKTCIGIILIINFEPGKMQHGECEWKRNLCISAQCCSKGEWRQLQGSFEQILQTTCLVSAFPTFVSHQVGILTALSTNQIWLPTLWLEFLYSGSMASRKQYGVVLPGMEPVGFSHQRLSLKTLSQFPFYVSNHPLAIYITDIFSLHRVGIYLAFNIYLLLGFSS